MMESSPQLPAGVEGRRGLCQVPAWTTASQGGLPCSRQLGWRTGQSGLPHSLPEPVSWARATLVPTQSLAAPPSVGSPLSWALLELPVSSVPMEKRQGSKKSQRSCSNTLRHGRYLEQATCSL